MAGGVEGGDVLEAEVPLEVRVQEGHHKRAGRAVDVDLDVPPVLLVQLACVSPSSSARILVDGHCPLPPHNLRQIVLLNTSWARVRKLF